MRRFYVAATLLLFACGTVIYLWRVPNDPPGFYIDESSICYNAHVISQTGHDEYGVQWPLFFRAFGEYKNPTLIYPLAAVFKATGPSIAALTVNELSQLRLIAFPVFFIVLIIPTMEWLTLAPGGNRDKPMLKRLLFAGAVMLIAIQGLYFQWHYHRSAPGLWYVFDARFPRKVLAPALDTGKKRIYLRGRQCEASAL